MRKISILGSTGSIGVSTMDVVRHLHPEIQVVGIAAHKNIDLLEKQAQEFSVQMVAVYDVEKAKELKRRLPSSIEVVSGEEGLKQVASLESVELVVSAMSGNTGIAPTALAIQKGKDVALANKEILVTAGSYIQSLVKKHGVKLLPIDSEHSALFQCLEGRKQEEVRRLILTASGGPFYRYSDEMLKSATLEGALAHPNWRMGPKVTVDSSTLMNKGLEVIEAHFLFSTPVEKIDVVVHPQSIIHSMVEFQDGSILAQASEPDMKLPIQHTLTYPDRRAGILPPFDFMKARTLEFLPYNKEKFPCLNLAFEALRIGKSMPCYLNAVNEVLVSRFLERQISWHDIARKLEKMLSLHKPYEILHLEEIFEVDTMARKQALFF